jgi:hypothetical protein
VRSRRSLRAATTTFRLVRSPVASFDSLIRRRRVPIGRGPFPVPSLTSHTPTGRTGWFRRERPRRSPVEGEVVAKLGKLGVPVGPGAVVEVPIHPCLSRLGVSGGVGGVVLVARWEGVPDGEPAREGCGVGLTPSW